MKLRSITLSDVRQFTQAVQVAGIADGLNVLSAPNESGKSTVFDAIHALFFIPHRSTRIADLRPAVGGNPQITIEVDLDGVLHRLNKIWGRGKLAEVWRAERLIAKGDEAESFISGLTLPAEEGGPAGLLWVRQGLTALDQGNAKELKHAFQARRDLMSSVTGEFEALTGGKRMDRALSQAQADLDALVTLRGAKAGGAYDLALKDLARLDALCASLSERAVRLQSALETRRTQRRAQRDLSDPVEVETRTARLAKAQTAFETASRHADALRSAQADLQRAEVAEAGAAQQRARREKTALAVGALSEALAAARQSAAQSTEAATAAKSALDAARARATTAREARRAADAHLQAALRAAARHSQLARLHDLTGAFNEASALTALLPDLRTAAQTGPDAALVQAIDAAELELRLAQQLAAAAAPHVTAQYANAQVPRLTLGAAPLEDGVSLALHQAATLTVPGIGQITIAPGQGPDGPDRQANASATLADLLARSATGSAADARAAARDRLAAQSELKATMTQIQRLAPDGIDALKSELQLLSSDIPKPIRISPEDAQIAANIAAQEAENADIALETIRVHHDVADQNHLRATLERDNLETRLTEAQNALDELPDIQTLTDTHSEAAQGLAEANSRHSLLTTDAPDLEAAKVAYDRAADVAKRAEAEIAALNIELAGLDATIETQAGDGVEEDLAEAREQRATARETVAVFETEIAVLKHLIAALVTAQSSARDRYFAPVLAELRPMLRLLWPGAELRFDGDSLLPSALIRGDQAEPIGTLSGGTREQLALLVRLAFARLLAKQGKHAPVILDDALVYTDDDRIEQMFNALHAQSSELQILVFSCRNRALRALGGQNLRISPVATPA